MKCPRCNKEQTRLSWLREFTVVYWCSACHMGFELNRHRSRLINSPPASTPGERHADAVAARAR